MDYTGDMLDDDLRTRIADYVRSNAEAYIAWQRSGAWDESYKWSVLKGLSEELSQYSEATDANVDSIVAIYKKHNPTQGSFVRYTYFKDFEEVLADKSAAAKFINAVWDADFETANNYFVNYSYQGRSFGTPGIGYLAAGRNPSSWPLFRGEFYDGMVTTLQMDLRPSNNAQKYLLYKDIVNIISENLAPSLMDSSYDEPFMSLPAVYGQDFLYFKFFNWNENRLLYAIGQFITQADGNVGKSVQDADLTSRQYKMQYMGVQISASFGQGGVARVPWISLGFGGSYDFFPTFLYYAEYNTLILAFDATRDKKPNQVWQDIDQYQRIKEFFDEKGLSTEGSLSRYSESRVYKSYDTKKSLPESLLDDVRSILDLYEYQLENIRPNNGDDGVDLLALARKFVDYSDRSIAVRSEFKVEYKGAKGRAWVTVRDAQRMETTWFIFGKDNVERGGPWDGDRFGLLYSRDTSKLYLSHNWADENRQTLEALGTQNWGDWTAYKVYDPHDIPETFANDFDVLVDEYNERSKMKDIDTSKSNNIALNTIIYGPPGTGKTYSINGIRKDLIDDQHRESIDPLEGITTWGDAILRVFTENDYQPLSVNEITKSPTMQAYAATRNSKTPYGTISTQILGNATEDSTNSTYRLGTDKFQKTDGKWSLTEIGRAEADELSAVLQTEQNETGDTDHFFKFITFHQSYGYEEFIEGIRPETDESGQLLYGVRDGVFKTFCRRAEDDPSNNYLFVIDEINRGNISKIFGELITLLEPNKRLGANEAMTTTLPYSNEKFGVPKNVYVVGTMNTADRSIALLDIALRRRFDFKEIMPKPSLLSDDLDGVNLQRLLSAINAKVAEEIDRNHQIGHSYLMDISSTAELHSAWYQRVIPLLQEYFYDDNNDLRSILRSFVDKDEIVLLEGEEFKQALIGIYEETQTTDSGIQL